MLLPDNKAVPGKMTGKKTIAVHLFAFIKSLHLLLLFFLQLACLFSFSQKPNISFDHLDINSGLSQNHIMCTLQDSRGFMWFGTRDGLNKYDGYRFTIYKNDPADPNSISNNFIFGIAEDSKGNIWVSTRGGGLNRYDKDLDRFTQFKNIPGNPNSIASDLSAGMTVDDKDNIWICAENGGLSYYEPAKNRFTRLTHDENNNKSLTNNNTRCVLKTRKIICGLVLMAEG